MPDEIVQWLWIAFGFGVVVVICMALSDAISRNR